MVETSLACAVPNNSSISVLASDELGNALDQIQVNGVAVPGSIWDAFTWGASPWGASLPPFQQQPLQWHLPLVFKQLSLRMTTQAMAGVVFGNVYLKYQTLGYLLK